ncbi:hypothetical protein KKF84_02370 [Myxococcota bacterium]|nr:hypothetical protein [Myxococcota bacterium]
MNEQNLRNHFTSIGKAVNTILESTCDIIIELRGSPEAAAEPESASTEGRISPRQVKLLRKIASERNWDWDEFSDKVKQRFNRTVVYLSKKQASDLIGELLEKGGSHGTGTH